MKYEQYTSAWGKDRSADEIQEDLQQIRSEISHTLEELEDKLSPRAVAGRARRAPARKARELAQRGRERPGRAALILAPLLLLGALLGWRAWSRRRRSADGRAARRGPSRAHRLKYAFDRGREAAREHRARHG